jgi:hypothetical protein
MCQLIITLTNPAKFFEGCPATGTSLRIGKLITTGPLWTPWTSLPDMLVDTATNTLLGLTYGVPSPLEWVVNKLALDFDSRVFRVVGTRGTLEVHIRWSATEPDGVLPGQLLDVGWYYIEERRLKGRIPEDYRAFLETWGVDLAAQFPVAVGIELASITDAEKLATPQKLILPVQPIQMILP